MDGFHDFILSASATCLLMGFEVMIGLGWGYGLSACVYHRISESSVSVSGNDTSIIQIRLLNIFFS